MRRRPDPSAAARRAVVPTAAAAALSLGLAACGGGPSSKSAETQVPLPPGPHVDLLIQAAKGTRYQLLCGIRAYKVGPGQYANRYGVAQAGPFKDVIPSPNARCAAKIVSGAAPVVITLAKGATRQETTLVRAGDAGEKTFQIW